MRRALVCSCMLLASLAAGAQAPAPIVFFDVAGPEAAKLAAKLAEVAANGGTIDAPRFEVPGVVVLGLFRDPAGNPMGLVETVDGKAKIP